MHVTREGLLPATGRGACKATTGNSRFDASEEARYNQAALYSFAWAEERVDASGLHIITTSSHHKRPGASRTSESQPVELRERRGSFFDWPKWFGQ